jgi:hypothetical protein
MNGNIAKDTNEDIRELLSQLDTDNLLRVLWYVRYKWLKHKVMEFFKGGTK